MYFVTLFLLTQQTDPAHQRLMYIPGHHSGHPQALYHIHPNSYLGRSHPPGQVVRLPSPATPPIIMTPPPPSVMGKWEFSVNTKSLHYIWDFMMICSGMGSSTIGHHVALTNFKSRSPWEQEVLRAHNVVRVIKRKSGSMIYYRAWTSTAPLFSLTTRSDSFTNA